jgi:hypothetical protein
VLFCFDDSGKNKSGQNGQDVALERSLQSIVGLVVHFLRNAAVLQEDCPDIFDSPVFAGLKEAVRRPLFETRILNSNTSKTLSKLPCAAADLG